MEDTENPAGNIFIGERFVSDFGVSLTGLKYGGYIIRSRGADILIAGGNDAATARGVYGFLTDYLGVRWYGPGTLWEVIPERKTITVPKLDARCEPDFGYRLFSGINGEEGVDWCRRNRMDLRAADLPYFGFGHNLARIFPPEKYGEAHPEYYAMVGGKRNVPSAIDRNSQPCFSNSDVVDIAAEAARQFFEDNPDRTTFSLCTNDNPSFCRCPECDRLDSPRRTFKAGHTNVKSGWPIHSESYFSFVERVAKKVSKTNPDKYLGCYAYWNVELPPRNFDNLPNNVVVALTQETSQHFDSIYKALDRELWLAWSNKAAHLGKYDYYGLAWMTPRYFPTLAAEDIKFIHKNGAIGFYTSINTPYYMLAPQIYLTAQLLWRSDQDLSKILDRYFVDLYGGAALEMKAFYDVLERYWTQPRKAYWLQGGKLHQEFGIANADLIEEAWACLGRAKHKAVDQQLARVLYMESNFRFSYVVVRAFIRVRDLAILPLQTEEDIAAYIREIETALGEIRVAEDTYQNVVLKDSIDNHMYSLGDRFNRQFSSLQNYLKFTLRRAVSRLERCCPEIMERETGQIVIEDLRARLSSDPVGQRFGLGQPNQCVQDVE